MSTTKYVLTDGSNNVVTYPYSLEKLAADHPEVSFSSDFFSNLSGLASFNVFPVNSSTPPTVNPLTETLEETIPHLVTGVWYQQWLVTVASPSEQAARYARFSAASDFQASRLLNESNQYVLQAAMDGVDLHADLYSYRAALSSPSTLSGYPVSTVFPALPSNLYSTTPSLPFDSYTKAETDTLISNMSSTLVGDISKAVLKKKVLAVEPPSMSMLAPDATLSTALSTLTTDAGWCVELGSGIYPESSTLTFGAWSQFQIYGPYAANTTVATIQGNTVFPSTVAGVRTSRLQLQGTVLVQSNSGLGKYFDRVQISGALTIDGAASGFIVFNECEITSDITVASTFAGIVYFNKCSFASSGAALYQTLQASASQVVVSDCSNVPNGGFNRASYSGVLTYKNATQQLYLGGFPLSLAGATNGQVLTVITGTQTVIKPTAPPMDSTKLPLAGGTMTGPLALAADPNQAMQATTKQYVDAAVAAVSSSGSSPSSTVTAGSSLVSVQSSRYFKLSLTGNGMGITLQNVPTSTSSVVEIMLDVSFQTGTGSTPAALGAVVDWGVAISASPDLPTTFATTSSHILRILLIPASHKAILIGATKY